MRYALEVAGWLVLGAFAGQLLGEGIGHLRRTRSSARGRR